jgi:hypothetical protein
VEALSKVPYLHYALHVDALFLVKTVTAFDIGNRIYTSADAFLTLFADGRIIRDPANRITSGSLLCN